MILERNLLSLGPAKGFIKIVILKMPQASWQVVAEFTTSCQVILKLKERLRSSDTTDNLFPWESSVINFLLSNSLHIIQLLWDFPDQKKKSHWDAWSKVLYGLTHLTVWDSITQHELAGEKLGKFQKLQCGIILQQSVLNFPDSRPSWSFVFIMWRFSNNSINRLFWTLSEQKHKWSQKCLTGNRF